MRPGGSRAFRPIHSVAADASETAGPTLFPPKMDRIANSCRGTGRRWKADDVGSPALAIVVSTVTGAGAAKHGKLKVLLINATSCRVRSRIDSALVGPSGQRSPLPRHPPPPGQKSLSSEATTSGSPEPKTARGFFLWRSSHLFPAKPILPQRVPLKPHCSEIRA
jgi:hypothetical protein